MLTARRILIATGAVDEGPDIPGARERWGRDFLHCPYCHGWEVRDQPLEASSRHRTNRCSTPQLVHQWSDDLVFFSHTQTVSSTQRRQLDARGITIVDGIVTRLLAEDDHLTGTEKFEDSSVIPRAAVFIRPSNVLRADGLLDRLGVELDEAN